MIVVRETFEWTCGHGIRLMADFGIADLNGKIGAKAFIYPELHKGVFRWLLIRRNTRNECIFGASLPSRYYPSQDDAEAEAKKFFQKQEKYCNKNQARHRFPYIVYL